MKQILDKSELIGKTIKAIHEQDEALCILYDDDTFSVFYYYDRRYSLINSEWKMIDFNPSTRYQASTLLEFGLITAKKYDEYASIFSKKALEEEAAKELALYEDLKKRFGK